MKDGPVELLGDKEEPDKEPNRGATQGKSYDPEKTDKKRPNKGPLKINQRQQRQAKPRQVPGTNNKRYKHQASMAETNNKDSFRDKKKKKDKREDKDKRKRKRADRDPNQPHYTNTNQPGTPHTSTRLRSCSGPTTSHPAPPCSAPTTDHPASSNTIQTPPTLHRHILSGRYNQHTTLGCFSLQHSCPRCLIPQPTAPLHTRLHPTALTSMAS